MSYTAFSVTFGEVPTEAKWNYLGDNDASFNDGTGIADDAIIQRHYADNSVGVDQLTSPNLDYKEIGRDTLDATGTVLEVIFTAKKYIRVICGLVSQATGVNMNFTFNSDTGTNYAQQYSANHATPATTDVNIAGFAGEVGNFIADGVSFVVVDIYNPSGADKLASLQTVHQTALTAADYPRWSDLQAMWNNTTQVTSITATAVSGSLKAGSEMIILGHD